MSVTDDDLAGLLRAVLLDPRDDAPRLVYADALEERGGSDDADRAAFIRCQVASARHAAALRHSRELADRMQAPRVIFRECSGWGWHRGFIANVELDGDAFLQHAAEIFSSYPITSVTIGADNEPAFHDRGPGFAGWYWPLRHHPSRPFCPRSYYATPEGALRGLSASCVRWGRREAGLPHIRGLAGNGDGEWDE